MTAGAPGLRIVIGRRYRYRTRLRETGVAVAHELVRKRNGWWFIGHDRTRNRTVEVQTGAVFPLTASLDATRFGPAYRWPRGDIAVPP